VKDIRILNSEIWVSIEFDFEYDTVEDHYQVTISALWSSESGWHNIDDNFLDQLSDEVREEFFLQLDEMPVPKVVFE